VSSKDSSDTNIIDIGSIPDTLTTEQVDLSDAVGSGAFKTAYQALGDPTHKDWNFLKIFFVNA
jgi:hypothetical protein